MGRHEEHAKFLTHQDLLRISFDSNRGKVFRFALQYEALIENRWRIILRIDNYHGTEPHKHQFHLRRRMVKLTIGGDPHRVFNEWQKLIAADYARIKESFIFSD